MKKFKVIERRNGKLFTTWEFETLEDAKTFVDGAGQYYETTHSQVKTVMQLLRADLYENEGDVFPAESYEIQENN